jgi:hypothetical protein
MKTRAVAELLSNLDRFEKEGSAVLPMSYSLFANRLADFGKWQDAAKHSRPRNDVNCATDQKKLSTCGRRVTTK